MRRFLTVAGAVALLFVSIGVPPAGARLTAPGAVAGAIVVHRSADYAITLQPLHLAGTQVIRGETYTGAMTTAAASGHLGGYSDSALTPGVITETGTLTQPLALKGRAGPASISATCAASGSYVSIVTIDRLVPLEVGFLARCTGAVNYQPRSSFWLSFSAPIDPVSAASYKACRNLQTNCRLTFAGDYTIK